MYKFGILTSLYDDDAPQLLATIDEAIESGVVEGEVPLVFCDKKEGQSEAVDSRIERIRQLKHLSNLVFLPPSSVNLSGGKLEKRLQYDAVAAEALAGSGASSFLNIGWMRIMTPLIHEPFDIVNLHPAIPETGPKGMWPDVMREQAERPLKDVAYTDSPDVDAIMQNMHNKAGGMLHLVSEELDHGQVLSWYEFQLTTQRLYKLWGRNAENVRRYGMEAAKKMSYFNELTAEIRREQVQGEHPLLVLTYSHLSRGDWRIRDRILYTAEGPQVCGVRMSREIKRYLRDRGVETAIF